QKTATSWTVYARHASQTGAARPTLRSILRKTPLMSMRADSAKSANLIESNKTKENETIQYKWLTRCVCGFTSGGGSSMGSDGSTTTTSSSIRRHSSLRRSRHGCRRHSLRHSRHGRRLCHRRVRLHCGHHSSRSCLGCCCSRRHVQHRPARQQQCCQPGRRRPACQAGAQRQWRS
ncbi:hypothetical protein GQ42DRAFT_83287, partial [Ramicandelaber brevisporus]